MPKLINCHVIDQHNIGDLLSAPLRYFDFPGYETEYVDIRHLDAARLQNAHIILGGGGLLFPRFQSAIQTLIRLKQDHRLIAWGVGQQIYDMDSQSLEKSLQSLDYLQHFDQVGIRDFNTPFTWVPCASCLHPAFDKSYETQHEFVVFSHKKFQIDLGPFPRMTNATQNFEEVLAFLGSGETILTSSFHGAYWGTLLGRRVLAFPFSSKFLTFNHAPALYPVDNWRQPRKIIRIFGKTLYESPYAQHFVCSTEDWRAALQDCRTYPHSLAECRQANQHYYEQVLDLLQP